jgi:DNA-binding transcriptional regulator YdaS (Cro superfamily)
MRLDLYLEKSNTPVETFASEIGVHRTSVYRFIKGLAFPRPTTLQRIAEVTKGKVTANDFISVMPEERRRLVAVG